MLTTYVSNFLDVEESSRLYATCERLQFVRRPNPRNTAQFLKRGTITFQGAQLIGGAIIGPNHEDIRPLESAPRTILHLQERLTAYRGRPVNYLSINRYPDGSSGIGFHNHREDIGLDTPVLLVSVGAVRTMQLRRIGGTRVEETLLENGSLFIMEADLNQTHQHGILPENVLGVRYSFNCKCLEVA